MTARPVRREGQARPGSRADHGYGKPNASVDVAMLTLVGGALHACLVQRTAEPFRGMAALPGGYVHVDEDRELTDVAHRMLRDKAGLRPRFLEQLQTFGGRDRDPDGWSITVAYYTMLSPEELARATGVHTAPVDQLPALAFDHARIVAAAVARLRGKGSYSAIPAFLLPDTFTLSQLHAVYQQVLGTSLNKDSFRRKIEEQAIVEPAEGTRQDSNKRPARLYRIAAGMATEFDRRI